MFRLIRYLTKKQVFFFLLLLAFLVVQVFADVTLPTYTARIVEQMQAGAEALSILRTGGVMLAFAAVSVLATIAETFLSASISTGLGRRLRGEVFAHVLSLSDRTAGAFTAGSLLTRTTNDVQQVVSSMVLILRSRAANSPSSRRAPSSFCSAASPPSSPSRCPASSSSRSSPTVSTAPCAIRSRASASCAPTMRRSTSAPASKR